MGEARVNNEEHDAAVDLMLEEGGDDWGPVQKENMPSLSEKNNHEPDASNPK